MYSPHFGSETLNLTPKNDTNFKTLSSPTVNVIFYGSNLGDVNPLIQDVKSILASSYLSFLKVYGSDGHAKLGGVYVDSTFDDSKLKTKDDHEKADIAEIDKAIKSKQIAAPPTTSDVLSAPIFVVVEDPTISLNSGGYNKSLSYNPPGEKATTINFCAVHSPTRENFGRLFSHELVERMSDPTSDSNGVTITAPPGLPANLNGDSQIGDDEPDSNRYLYRLGGSTGPYGGPYVQPYWYQSFDTMLPVVPDGNTQVMTLIPSWGTDAQGNTRFNYAYDLSIKGDQRGSPDDTLTIESTVDGTTVVLNNESFFFYALSSTGTKNNKITSITIDLGSGTNTINLLASASDITIKGGGTDTVNLGKDGFTQGISGAVSITNPPAYTTVNVDDSADVRNQTFSISSGAITGLTQGVISYAQSDLAALNVMTGKGNNQITVLSTPLSGSRAVTTLAGHGLDQVMVGDAGSVQGVRGKLRLTNTSFDLLTIDDSADTTGRTATIDTPAAPDGFTYGVVTGLAPAPVEFRTIDMRPPVTVLTGTAANTIDVYSTLDEINLVGHGPDTVNVGRDGSVQGIRRKLSVSNPPNTTTLNIDDSGDTTGRTVAISSSSVTGLAPAAIAYSPNDLKALTILAGSGGSAFTVLGTPNRGPDGSITTSLSSRGADAVAVGNVGSLQGVVGNLVLTNSLGRDTLTVDDSADLTSHVAVLDAMTPVNDTIYGRIAGLAPGTITYRASDVTAPVHVLAGSGNDVITVNQTATVGITLDTGAGSNTVAVLQTLAPVAVNGQGVADAISVGDSAHNLNGITAPVSVAGNGTTLLTVDDEITRNRSHADILGRVIDTTNAVTFTLTDQSVVRVDTATDTVRGTGQIISQPTFITAVAYSGLAGLTVRGGSSGNAFNVTSSASGTPIAISAGAGDDAVAVGSVGAGLEPIRSTVSIDSQGGVNTLNVYDQASAAREEYDVYADHINREPITSLASAPTQRINYAQTASVLLWGGTGADIYTVAGTAAGTSVTLTAAHGGAPGDQFIVENAANTLDDIHGPVALHGGGVHDIVDMIDSGNTVGHTYTLSAGGVQRADLAAITYDGIGELIFAVGDSANGPANRDTVTVVGTSANALTAVAVGSGDSVILGAPVGDGTRHTLAAFAGELVVQASAAATPTITLDDSGDASTAARTVTFDSQSFGNYIAGMTPAAAPVFLRVGTGASIAVIGDGGDETFALRSLSAAGLRLDGGGGVNALDYTGYIGDISVNLRLGAATGLAGGIANFRNVTAGAGNAILVGDDLANVLLGGSGRNIVIGGGGADQLTGGAGDNILIGGTTDYDSNAAALQVVLSEWGRTDLNFATRLADLMAGVGSDKTLFTAATVHADGVQDVLTGGGQNWFLSPTGEDVLNNQSSVDVITPV